MTDLKKFEKAFEDLGLEYDVTKLEDRIVFDVSIFMGDYAHENYLVGCLDFNLDESLKD